MDVLDKLREENVKRCESPEGFNHKLDSWSTAEWMCAAAGELGEAANIAKKMLRITSGIQKVNKWKDMDIDVLRQELAGEIGDAIVYLDLIAKKEGIDLKAAITYSFNKKSEEIGYSGKI